MELLIVAGYTAICIAAFALLRIPLNRVSVPVASIGGIVLVFALVQVLNFYHPYTDNSRRFHSDRSIAAPVEGASTQQALAYREAYLVAWFNENSHFRLGDGAEAEVTFDSIPGKVFSARVRGMLPMPGKYRAPTRDQPYDSTAAATRSRIALVIDVTDPRFANYELQLADGFHARTAVYSDSFQHGELVRKTLLRMSAWLNYLTPVT